MATGELLQQQALTAEWAYNSRRRRPPTRSVPSAEYLIDIPLLLSSKDLIWQINKQTTMQTLVALVEKGERCDKYNYL